MKAALTSILLVILSATAATAVLCVLRERSMLHGAQAQLAATQAQLADAQTQLAEWIYENPYRVAIKELVKRNAGIQDGDSPETIALKLTDQLHHATVWNAPFASTNNDALRYLQTSWRIAGNYCSTLSTTLVWELTLFDISSREVYFGSKEFAEGANEFDSHVMVDAFIDGNEVAFDPTFNARYKCSDADRFASGIGLHECITRGGKLTPSYISPPQAGRDLASYYIPLDKLVYAVSAAARPDLFKTAEVPSSGWLQRVQKTYGGG